MKRALALVFVAGLGLSVTAAIPADVNANNGLKKVCVRHKANKGPPSVILKIPVVALPAHLAHGDRLTKCLRKKK